jgi:serine/threonine protein kinase
MPEPSDAERLIDEVCDRFEGRWRAGERPVVEDYLVAVPAAASDELLRELLRLEIDYRRRRGEQPSLEEYLPRWPAQSTLLQELLGEVLPAPQVAPAHPPAPLELELTASFQGTFPGDAAGNRGPSDERSTHVETSSDERITRVLPPTAVAALPEQLGRYKVLRLLRQGSTGTVYLAEDALADRLVAIKVPDFSAGSPPTAVERFRRSARAAARLTHANLCPIYEVGEWQGAPFLVMPHLALPSLADRLKEGPPFAPREAAELVRKLAMAMQVAHQAGVIHRDLNPANILLDAEGEPIVVDFGLARLVETGSSRLTQAGEVLGVPAYIAPEQLSGNPETHAASCDVFSLGVILYELLTGELPFGRTLQEVLLRIMTQDPAPPSSLRPEVGPELDGVCRQALARKVKDRFRSMGELAEALQGSPVHRESSRTQLLPGAGGLHAPFRKRGVLLLLALLAGIALASAVYFSRNDNGETVRAPERGSQAREKPREEPPSTGRGPPRAEKKPVDTRHEREPKAPDGKLPVPPMARKDADWEQLFNRKDRTGWKTHPDQPGDWRVEDGILKGRGGATHLFTNRGDFENFHVKVKARVASGGNSGLFFRSEFAWNSHHQPPVPRGYEVEMFGGVGALLEHFQTENPRTLTGRSVNLPKEWFTLEVIADGDRVAVLVDGRKLYDERLPPGYRVRGHLALQHFFGPVTEFASIEIKELPPTQANEAALAGPAKAEGFTPLFNGKDLAGWKRFGGQEDTWAAADGILFRNNRGGGWLMTEKVYSDFELQLEFKVPRGGNSGVALRSPLEGDPAYTGMEIQILDDEYPDYRSWKDWQKTGAIYGVVASSKQPTRPVGQWNSYRIVCQGRQVTLELNGERILEANLDDYMGMTADGKAHPGLLRDKGHIGLQDHTGRVEFRNIRIRTLK